MIDERDVWHTTFAQGGDVDERRRALEYALAIHRDLLGTLEVPQLREASAPELEKLINTSIGKLSEENGWHVTSQLRSNVLRLAMSELRGYGPLDPLLDDEDVSEIMVNGPDVVYVECRGVLQRSPVIFFDDDHVLRITDRIISPLGRRVDESSPMVDARLPDGSRVNAIIPPVALNGPCLTIRKFASDPFKADDLVRFGTITQEMSDFLRACVQAELNVLVSGGTGSGKTTTLNVLSSFIPNSERIVTIEDAAELQLQQEHIVTLESRPANLEGRGEVPIRQLVRNSLRMRPDRIIVGECRGAEALDMLQAMNTGHEGSMSTLHANAPRDALTRLETMVLMAGTELPSRAIRDQIVSALDLIVQQSRLRDGSRKIVAITEVQRLEGEVITMQDIYTFQQKGLDDEGHVLGEHRFTGLCPLFLDRLEALGVPLPTGMSRRCAA